MTTFIPLKWSTKVLSGADIFFKLQKQELFDINLTNIVSLFHCLWGCSTAHAFKTHVGRLALRKVSEKSSSAKQRNKNWLELVGVKDTFWLSRRLCKNKKITGQIVWRLAGKLEHYEDVGSDLNIWIDLWHPQNKSNVSSVLFLLLLISVKYFDLQVLYSRKGILTFFWISQEKNKSDVLSNSSVKKRRSRC